jgi:hypothetical protein
LKFKLYICNTMLSAILNSETKTNTFNWYWWQKYTFHFLCRKFRNRCSYICVSALKWNKRNVIIWHFLIFTIGTLFGNWEFETEKMKKKNTAKMKMKMMWIQKYRKEEHHMRWNRERKTFYSQSHVDTHHRSH